jgi:hypothetical protein
MPEDCYFVATFGDTDHAIIDGRTGIEVATLTDRQIAEDLTRTFNAAIN